MPQNFSNQKSLDMEIENHILTREQGISESDVVYSLNFMLFYDTLLGYQN
jgi:hypothetical protein